MIEVIIPLSDISCKIDTKTYYLGESYKAKDSGYSIVQSCSDNLDEIQSYVESAINEVIGKMLKRVKSIDNEFTDGKFIIKVESYDRIPDNKEYVVDLLKKEIIDYCVQYSAFQWVNLVKPEIAQPLSLMLPIMMNKIEKYISMISGIIKRRYTSFGI